MRHAPSSARIHSGAMLVCVGPRPPARASEVDQPAEAGFSVLRGIHPLAATAGTAPGGSPTEPRAAIWAEAPVRAADKPGGVERRLHSSANCSMGIARGFICRKLRAIAGAIRGNLRQAVGPRLKRLGKAMDSPKRTVGIHGSLVRTFGLTTTNAA